MHMLAHLGYAMENKDVELDGMSRLHRCGHLEDRYLPQFIDLLIQKKKFQLASEMCDAVLERLPKMKIAHKRKLRTFAEKNREYCDYQHQLKQRRTNLKTTSISPSKKTGQQEPAQKATPAAPPASAVPEPELPAIPVNITIDQASFQQALSAGVTSTHPQYEVALEGSAHPLQGCFREPDLPCPSTTHPIALVSGRDGPQGHEDLSGDEPFYRTRSDWARPSRHPSSCRNIFSGVW